MVRRFLLAVVVFSVACIKNNPSQAIPETPEELLKEFINVSASTTKPEDKKRLQELCAGELRRTFERMNYEAFRLIYVDTKIKVTSLKILNSDEQKELAKIQYEVSIENQGGTDPTKEINSREVEFSRKDGRWYIESIRMLGKDQVAFTRGMLF